MLVAVLFVGSAGVLGMIDAVVSVWGFGLALIALACILIGARYPTRPSLIAAPLAAIAYGVVYGLFTQPKGLVDLTDYALTYTCVAGFCFLLTGLFSILALDRHPWPPPDTNRCKKCDYLLIGLTEPRCPECGTPFDREKLASPVPSTTATGAS